MTHACSIRRQPQRPIYKPRNSGSAHGLQYAALVCMSAIVIMPMFMSLGNNIGHVFNTIGSAILGA